MRNRGLLIMAGFILFSFLGISAGIAQETNLIRNSGVEGGKDAPFFWRKWASEKKEIVAFIWDIAECHSGSKSVMIKGESPEAYGVWAPYDIPVQGGEAYCLSYWMKTENVEGASGARIYTGWVDKDKKSVPPAEHKGHLNKFVKGTAQWHKYQEIFVAGEKAVEMQIYGQLYKASGKVWFDDIEMRKITRGEFDKLKEEESKSLRLEGTNLALGKRYTFSTPPNYPYCTDPEDSVQLTDGMFTVGYFWTQKSTVGWRATRLIDGWMTKPLDEMVQIKLDLGDVYPIGKIGINSVGGGKAGVLFPSAILVFASMDDENYYLVTSIFHRLEEEYAGDKWFTHKFVTEPLKTKGRYILLTFCPRRDYLLFCDEIEVIKGEHNLSQVSLQECKMFSYKEIKGISPVQPVQSVQRAKLMLSAISGIKEQLPNKKIPLTEEKLIKAKISKIEESIKESIMDVKKQTELEKEMRMLQSHLYKDFFPEKEFVIWNKGLWEDLSPYEMVPLDLVSDLGKIEISMGKNEYESCGFLITNTSDKNIPIEIKVEKIKDMDIEVRYGFFVQPAEVNEKLTVADVLPSALENGRNIISLFPGETKQVWLTVKSDERLKQGDYTVKINAIPLLERSSEKSINLEIKVYPIALPESPALSTCVWGYLFQGSQGSVFDGLLSKEMAEDQLKHYITHFVMYPTEGIPVPKCDQEGNIIEPLDFTRLDKEINLLKNAKCIMFLWQGAFKDDFGVDLKWLSPEWKKALKSWLSLWVAHLSEKGVGYEKFAMYPWDEPNTELQKKRFIKLAQAIKEADPNIKIFVDLYLPYWRQEEIEQLKDHADIWCPTFGWKDFDRKFDGDKKIAFLQNAGKEVWNYNQPCAKKWESPFDGFRVAMWWAFKTGLNGYGTWAYDAIAGSAWDDNDGKGPDYLFVYDGKNAPFTTKEKLIPSKRWEAWREGIEDYGYLDMLEKGIRKAKERGVSGQLIAECEKSLTEEVERVIRNSEDPNVLYKARERITQKILELRNHGN